MHQRAVETDAERQRDRQKVRERKGQTYREADCGRQGRKSVIQTEREQGREMQKDRERHRGRDTDRDRHRQRYA